MSRAGAVKRYVGLAGAAAGVLAAGVAAGAVAQRRTVNRRRLEAEVPLGSLRGEPRTVIADDQLELYAEVDEPDEPTGAGVPTVVLVHGYALNLDCWHFQRIALGGAHRLVAYDQRSHGRSGRSRPEHCTVDQLGSDLAAVVDQLAGPGPVVLVGHSMGGMAIMALAEQHPEWFGTRVTAVGLISTSAGDLGEVTLGVPGLPGRLLHKATPSVIATAARAPRLVERGRRAGSDLAFALTRRLAFGGPVPPEYVDFTDEMLSATPIEVVADFFPGFDTHDKQRALSVLTEVPTSVISGDEDMLTPLSHGRRIAEEVPSATLLELPGGHMIILERHAEVNEALSELVDKAARA